jgi:quinol monooxygenase YgiN
MNVLSEKRMELSQTIASLSSSTKMEKGCQRCEFCRSIGDENRFFLLEEWDTQENLKNHLKSEHFKVIRGAMNLLQEPYEAMFHTIFHPAGMENDLMGASRSRKILPKLLIPSIVKVS